MRAHLGSVVAETAEEVSCLGIEGRQIGRSPSSTPFALARGGIARVLIDYMVCLARHGSGNLRVDPEAEETADRLHRIVGIGEKVFIADLMVGGGGECRPARRLDSLAPFSCCIRDGGRSPGL